jgi:hypothetical protein
LPLSAGRGHHQQQWAKLLQTLLHPVTLTAGVVGPIVVLPAMLLQLPFCS